MHDLYDCLSSPLALISPPRILLMNDTHKLDLVRERLLAFIRKRVDSNADAEDILQDVLVRMQEGLDGLESETRFHAWLYQIARNAVTDFYRTRSRHNRALERVDEDPTIRIHRCKEDASAYRELAGCIEPLVEQLPPKYRTAIRLTDLGEFTQAGAAEELGLSVSGVKSRVQRGRKHLEGLLRECCELDLDHRGHLMDFGSPADDCCGK